MIALRSLEGQSSMKEYKGYNIPERSDLKTEGIVVPMGGSLMVKLSDDMLFDTGIAPTHVYEMSEKDFNDLVYSRASGYIDAVMELG